MNIYVGYTYNLCNWKNVVEVQKSDEFVIRITLISLKYYVL
jgi:hypothetical protein